MNLPNVDPVFLSNPNARTFWEFLRKSRTQFRGWSPKFRAAEQNCPRWKNKKEIQNIFFVQVTKSDLASRSRKNTSLWVSPTHLNVSRTVSNTSSPSISPRPTPRDFALNFSQVGTVGGGFCMVVVGMVRMRWVCYQKYCQVGLVAVGAVKMKRKILPAGSEDWPKDLIQEKLLEAVTCPNICLQVAIFYFGQN